VHSLKMSINDNYVVVVVVDVISPATPAHQGKA
jgi:hypothetical protein